MPIGKSSIQRAAKAAGTPKKEPQKTDAAKTPKQGAQVTGHVIANISPEVVERVVGHPLPETASAADSSADTAAGAAKKSNTPKDGKVPILAPMPDYLL